MSRSAATVEFDHAAKSYPGTAEPAIQDLSLEVPPGKLTIFIGPSGSGKTTAMRLVNRMLELPSGDVRVDGVSVRDRPAAELRRSIGYAIQQIGLFPHQNVAENIATVPRRRGWDGKRLTARVAELLDLVGLEPAMGKRYPAQLSGGQRQRVGVARALAADPPLLLMDEPFGAIDPITRARLQEEFLRLQDELRKTVVFVTHDIDEAVRLGDRIAVLSDGGVLQQYDSPANVLGRPGTPFVADFVGGDRGLKRLSVTPIDASGLEPPPGELRDPSDMPATVPVGATLRDALAQLLLHDAPFVGVVDGDRCVGVLTADGLHTELRKSLTDDGQ